MSDRRCIQAEHQGFHCLGSYWDMAGKLVSFDSGVRGSIRVSVIETGIFAFVLLVWMYFSILTAVGVVRSTDVVGPLCIGIFLLVSYRYHSPSVMW